MKGSIRDGLSNLSSAGTKKRQPGSYLPQPQPGFLRDSKQAKTPISQLLYKNINLSLAPQSQQPQQQQQQQQPKVNNFISSYQPSSQPNSNTISYQQPQLQQPSMQQQQLGQDMQQQQMQYQQLIQQPQLQQQSISIQQQQINKYNNGSTGYSNSNNNNPSISHQYSYSAHHSRKASQNYDVSPARLPSNSKLVKRTVQQPQSNTLPFQKINPDSQQYQQHQSLLPSQSSQFPSPKESSQALTYLEQDNQLQYQQQAQQQINPNSNTNNNNNSNINSFSYDMPSDQRNNNGPIMNINKMGIIANNSMIPSDNSNNNTGGQQQQQYYSRNQATGGLNMQPKMLNQLVPKATIDIVSSTNTRQISFKPELNQFVNSQQTQQFQKPSDKSQQELQQQQLQQQQQQLMLQKQQEQLILQQQQQTQQRQQQQQQQQHQMQLQQQQQQKQPQQNVSISIQDNNNNNKQKQGSFVNYTVFRELQNRSSKEDTANLSAKHSRDQSTNSGATAASNKSQTNSRSSSISNSTFNVPPSNFERSSSSQQGGSFSTPNPIEKVQSFEQAASATNQFSLNLQSQQQQQLLLKQQAQQPQQQQQYSNRQQQQSFSSQQYSQGLSATPSSSPGHSSAKRKEVKIAIPNNQNQQKVISLQESAEEAMTNAKQEDFYINKSQFNIQFVIGKGGFGKVWRVEQRKTRQIFAMKEMSKSLIITKKSVNSVINERNLLCSLKHPFIVNMFYAFQDRDNLYLVMDFMSGGDLRFHIGKQRRFNEEQTRFFVACIFMGLEYLHKNNIIHRDIKPENLVLDSDGYVRVTDLGIARHWKPDNQNDTSGTPGYMAPEVMCRQPHTFAVDYFALGVIAFEFMLGRRPYLGRSRQEIRNQILAKRVQIKKNEIPEGWSLEAADFINRLIERKPAQRLGINGPDEVKNHPWIRNFPWKKLYNKELQAPFMASQEDNFDFKQQISADDEETNELIQQNAMLLRKPQVQSLFGGYNFDNTLASNSGTAISSENSISSINRYQTSSSTANKKTTSNVTSGTGNSIGSLTSTPVNKKQEIVNIALSNPKSNGEIGTSSSNSTAAAFAAGRGFFLKN